MQFLHKGLVFGGQRHKHRAHLMHAVSVRPRKTGDADADVGCENLPDVFRHLCRHLIADCPFRGNHVRVNAQHLSLCLIGVGHRAALEKRAGARDIGEAFGRLPAGAALGKGKGPWVLLQQRKNGLFQIFHINAVDEFSQPVADMCNHGGAHGLRFRLAAGLGRHLEQAVCLLGIGCKAGVGHAVHFVGKNVVHAALPDAEDTHRVGDDHLIAQPFQIGHHALFEHCPALFGRARQHDDDLAVLFKGTPGSRPACVVEDRAALRQHGLLGVVLGVFVPGGDIVIEGFIFLFIPLQLQAEGLCQRVLGQVIAGGAQPAGGDDDVRPLLRYFNALLKPAGVVAHHRVIEHIDADACQRLGNISCIRVGDVAQQQLRSDGDNLGVVDSVHGCSPTGMCSRLFSASVIRPSTSRAASTASTSFSFGLVRGWRGVNTVQQSS